MALIKTKGLVVKEIPFEDTDKILKRGRRSKTEGPKIPEGAGAVHPMEPRY